MNESVRPGVLFVLASLESGGAERTVLNVANGLCDSARVLLALVRPVGPLLAELDPRVEVFDLGGLRRCWWRLPALVWSSRPRAVLATHSDIGIGLMLLRALLPRGVRIVLRESSMPDVWLAYWRWPQLMYLLYRWTYPRADRLVLLSRAMQRRYAEFAGCKPTNAVIVPNAVDPARLEGSQGTLLPFTGPYLIAVGRLIVEKGYDVLIEAFARLPARCAPYRLLIVGEGPERARLEALITRFELGGRVVLTGFRDNPADWVRGAALFVLSSRVEGMPNAAIEALCLGTPVIAVTENTGADEFVRDGENGWRVERCATEPLAIALSRALERSPSPQERAAIAASAREHHSAAAMLEAYRAVLLR